MENRPSQGLSFFEQIKKSIDAVGFLRALVNSNPPTTETSYLDFKGACVPPRAGQPEQPLEEKEVKKLWSEAIGGFANTGGGVIIWGIDCRRKTNEPNGQQVDCASDFSLVPNPFVFRDTLKRLQLQTTDPPVPGVEIEAYPDPDANGRGFVVCYIPESPFKPHRSEDSKVKSWHMRVGDSFIVIPPSILRSLFYPQRVSHLSIELKHKVINQPLKPHGQGYFRANFEPICFSMGPATATGIHVVIPKLTGMKLEAPPSFKPNPAGGTFTYTLPDPIHPGQSIAFVSFSIDFQIDQNGKSSVDFPLTIEFKIYLQDQFPIQLSFSYTQDELMKDGQKVERAIPLPMPNYSANS
jgi:hypothetical protein